MFFRIVLFVWDGGNVLFLSTLQIYLKIIRRVYMFSIALFINVSEKLSNKPSITINAARAIFLSTNAFSAQMTIICMANWLDFPIWLEHCSLYKGVSARTSFPFYQFLKGLKEKRSQIYKSTQFGQGICMNTT